MTEDFKINTYSAYYKVPNGFARSFGLDFFRRSLK